MSSPMQNTLVTMFMKTHINPVTNCWEWQGRKNRGGYAEGCFNGKNQRIHRAVYQFLNGEVSPNIDICHTCDVRHCVNPEHLFAGTRQENLQDMIRKNRHYNAISPELQEKIIALGATGMSQAKIAKHLKVDSTTVRRFVYAETIPGKPVRISKDGLHLDFESLTAAAKYIGVKQYCVSRVAQGIRNIVKGYRVKYI
jgi:hypothetical protein